MNDKVNYWLELCDEDLITAKVLLKSKRLLHLGFVCHMIVEKSLKAAIANKTSEIPPKIHNLIRLANLGDVADDLSEEQLNLLDELKPLQIEARYPEYKTAIRETLTLEQCKRLLKETEDFLCWIKKRLDR